MYGVRLAHRPTRADRFKPGRWVHPRPDLSSWTPWATTPERHQGAQRPPHPRQRAGQPSHPWATTPITTPSANTDRHTITPNGFRINDKPNLTASIPMGNSAVGSAAREWELTKDQFALTVKNLTRFLGFDLRIDVFGQFGFLDIYLEQKNIKTAHFSVLKQSKTILKQDICRLNLHQIDRIGTMSCT